MKKIDIYVTEKQYKILKVLSARDDMPYSEIIRRAIDRYIERRHDPWNLISKPRTSTYPITYQQKPPQGGKRDEYNQTGSTIAK